jgi:peptidoglycan/LPS O-acetylase OafA/YrhL
VVLCRRQWRPRLVLLGLCALALISPAWLIVVHLTTSVPNGMRLWLPTYLIWFLAGMSLTVLQAMGVGCYAFVALPLAVICYFIASTPLAGDPTTSPLGLSQALYKAVFYAAIAALAVAPLALGNQGWYARFLASRSMVWLGEISYEIFLIHLITMEIAMVYVMRDHVYTGSMPGLFVATLALTIPLAWLLHRFTRVRS